MVRMTAGKPRLRDMPDRPDAPEDFGVLLGWSHITFNRGIDLRVQSAARNAPGPREIENRHYLMTRNQALILAKYLLDVTGQELPAPRRPGLVGRLLGRVFGSGNK